MNWRRVLHYTTSNLSLHCLQRSSLFIQNYRKPYTFMIQVHDTRYLVLKSDETVCFSYFSCALLRISKTLCVWFLCHLNVMAIWRLDNMSLCTSHLGRVKRIWYLSPMRAAKVQAILRIRAVSPEPPLLAHTSIESRGIFRQKARSLAHLNGWACAVKICHDGMLEDTNSLDGAHLIAGT